VTRLSQYGQPVTLGKEMGMRSDALFVDTVIASHHLKPQIYLIYQKQNGIGP
jgi:hypothetical protein